MSKTQSTRKPAVKVVMGLGIITPAVKQHLAKKAERLDTRPAERAPLVPAGQAVTNQGR